LHDLRSPEADITIEYAKLHAQSIPSIRYFSLKKYRRDVILQPLPLDYLRGVVPVLLLAIALAPLSFAQAASDPDLSGTWLDSSNSAEKITFNEKGDKIQVREQDGDKVLADYTCNLSGQQCNVKEAGHPVKVMIYYNGSKLIEIKERGSDVEKRRFSLGQDGKTMLVETIPLSSAGGQPITRTYQKENSQVAKK
jgi:hypothetical protein